MTTSLQIDFVSDVACPWCAVGLGALEQALAHVQGDISAELHFQPFELNPHMGPEGQDMTEHLSEKYGSTPEQQAQIRETIRQRGAEVGFTFKPEGRGRIWNTFDAHRLLHWAALQGTDKQHALKKELLNAYHGRAENVSDAEVLAHACASAGLDAAQARAILAGDDYADAVRENEMQWQQVGIRSVPAIVINRQYLISGGQPVAVFEEALRKIAADSSAQA
ncbi:MAG: DsbA family oxidoreductase [Hylemonella sp.]|nr:DsbA family oxidoreductase [Hylemonella sp.]MDP1935957.1 DsbA family oxidoreductase [Hylemonella sp.]